MNTRTLDLTATQSGVWSAEQQPVNEARFETGAYEIGSRKNAEPSCECAESGKYSQCRILVVHIYTLRRSFLHQGISPHKISHYCCDQIDHAIFLLLLKSISIANAEAQLSPRSGDPLQRSVGLTIRRCRRASFLLANTRRPKI